MDLVAERYKEFKTKEKKNKTDINIKQSWY